ncbi:hypothetical protein HOH45_00395 [bacterium]|nr:hypothetical protein [bacterium]
MTVNIAEKIEKSEEYLDLKSNRLIGIYKKLTILMINPEFATESINLVNSRKALYSDDRSHTGHFLSENSHECKESHVA